MTSYDWHTERDKAIHNFDGELPNAQTEEAIRTAFQERPQITIALLHECADLKRQGKARSAWAVANHRLNVLNTPTMAAVDSSERDQAIRKAENWIRNAGHHYDREAELQHALFDRGAPLHPWHTDLALRNRMLELYRQHHNEQEPT